MSASTVKERQRHDLIRLGAFVVLSAVVIAWLGAVMAETRPGHYDTYSAVFRDVSGLAPGDQVRIAGADVGKVDRLDVRPDSTVVVTFHIRPGNPLNVSSQAIVQYKNLIGDRDLLLTRPDAQGEALRPGARIPSSRTQAALDLDTLLNGFKPLFAGLTPRQINDLSGELVSVLQGQGSAITTLVRTVGSFTTAIGDRESLISSVVNNLNTVLGTVDDRRSTLGGLIDQLDQLVSGLHQQDTQVLDAAHQIDGFASSAAGLLQQSRSSLTPDLTSLTVAARGLDQHADTLQQVLAKLPGHYSKIEDTASYGNYFNFFLCGVRLTLSGSGDTATQTPWIKSDVARCQR